MEEMQDEVEEGECSSDDDGIAGYNPIQRPTAAQPNVKKPEVFDDSEDEDAPEPPSDSDSDDDTPARKKRNKAGLWGRRDAIVPETGNNEVFKKMAAAFQAERNAKKKKNNIWGSFIQEETLNSDMSGFGVKRSLKDLNSDRGAETYDFTIPLEENAKERERQRNERKKRRDDTDMDSYWGEGGDDAKAEDTMEAEDGADTDKPKIEEKRGTKRSAKDRLGKKRIKMDSYNGERLAAPGEPKDLIDVGEEDLLETTEKEFGTLLAERLGEEKPELLEGIVKTFGKELAHKLYKLTQKKEAAGGMEIHNGARRRTSGGVFLYLFKTDDSLNLDKEKVKRFLAESKKQEDRKILEAKKRKKDKNFDKEMAEFLNLRKEVAKKEAEEEKKMEEDGDGGGSVVVDGAGEEEELEQLQTNAFSKIIGSLNKTERPAVDRLQSFQEPEAPPNSVERVDRTIQEYDDDLFS